MRRRGTGLVRDDEIAGEWCERRPVTGDVVEDHDEDDVVGRVVGAVVVDRQDRRPLREVARHVEAVGGQGTDCCHDPVGGDRRPGGCHVDGVDVEDLLVRPAVDRRVDRAQDLLTLRDVSQRGDERIGVDAAPQADASGML